MKLPYWIFRTSVMFLLIGIFIGSPQLAPAEECPPDRESQVPKPEIPIVLDKIKFQLYQYYSGHYSDEIALVLDDARTYVKKRASLVRNPALVLDIDETALSNWQNLKANDLGFIAEGPCDLLPKGPCGFLAWTRKHAASAIAPTLILFNQAKANGVAVFFLTGRRAVDRKITIVNLNLAGYEGWKKLIMRPDDNHGPISVFKAAERQRIEAQGYTIVANVGDQRSDLDGGAAECAFKLPNPFYFIP
jgi:HAD superfamily, subfamily IIIB (Acid phosphatase)